MSKPARAVLLPGASQPAADDLDPGDDVASQAAAADETEQSELAALRAENAKLRAAAAKPNKPTVLFEPVTPHGAKALAASAFAGLTVAELVQKIDSGEAREPVTNVLCSDGYYCSRAKREA